MVNVQENVELEFQMEVELAKVELKYQIAHLYLGTIVVFIGPVPVVSTIEMPINCGATAKSLWGSLPRSRSKPQCLPACVIKASNGRRWRA